MKEIIIFCEGATEQGFCRQVLEPHLSLRSSVRIPTFSVGEKNHRHLYGISRKNKYQKVRDFIQNTLKSHRGNHRRFTTMIDLYALPKDFPGQAENIRNPTDPMPYILALEKAWDEDIDDFRFIPHIQLHEYETMLLSNPEAFHISFDDCESQIEELKALVSSVPCIEHINDGRETAPSKRIIKLIPAYQGRKPSAGPDIAEFIGLDTIRAKCPHFDRWLSQLEEFVVANP
jgi:hypothetical protein